MPASRVVRAARSSRTCSAIWLKWPAKSASSRGPVRGSRSGLAPVASCAAAFSSLATGWAMRRASQSAATEAIETPASTATTKAHKGRV